MRNLEYLYEATKATHDLFERRLKIVAILTKMIEKEHGTVPVIVGGSAVAIYSQGLYATNDTDLILLSYVDVQPYMLELKFNKFGKDYYNNDLDVLVEFPSGNLAGSPEKITVHEVWENYPVYILGVEDLILDRINSHVSTNDTGSKEWALRLMGALYDSIDWSYIHKVAHEQEVLQTIEKFQRTVKRYRRNLDKLF
ncbi:DUF6036 family nucleotidyltransferase [Paenibacillus sp. MER 99-2]|uniref:DUF6036 family nucleotidyltransferase n=1 Tax=Paenibacillus sp. MER 99-2 TaxID=2939572 RepID=UPI00203EEE42|nr:DUF6036 family nucleotidyltransferase [Paenibacillus sp. MER 99-2]MCM3175547.1 DUF6036 family nucleotidyltransferase [Paenibacillus sp. MER 99-2]